MKKIFTYTFAIIICLALGSCKKDRYEKNASSLAGMQKLLSEVYQAIPMDVFNVNDHYTTLATYSDGCDYAVKLTGFWDYDKIRSINRFMISHLNSICSEINDASISFLSPGMSLPMVVKYNSLYSCLTSRNGLPSSLNMENDLHGIVSPSQDM